MKGVIVIQNDWALAFWQSAASEQSALYIRFLRTEGREVIGEVEVFMPH